jgi:hypothetical protein
VGVEVKFKPVEVIEKAADERGRVTLGKEYANKDVKLLVIE